MVTEWRQYARDDNGLIIKKNDHCMDALFYALKGLCYARLEMEYADTGEAMMWRRNRRMRLSSLRGRGGGGYM